MKWVGGRDTSGRDRAGGGPVFLVGLTLFRWEVLAFGSAFLLSSLFFYTWRGGGCLFAGLSLLLRPWGGGWGLPAARRAAVWLFGVECRVGRLLVCFGPRHQRARFLWGLGTADGGDHQGRMR